MNTIQTIIVGLWFVPVLGFIVIPLFWSLAGMLYRSVERSRLTDIRGFVTLNNRDAAGAGKKENRNRPRIYLEKGKACIAEKSGCGKASVQNISKQGICLQDVPRKLDLESDPIRIVFRTRQKDYSITAKPIWKRVTGKGYVIGAKLDQIPASWKDLVTGLNQSLTAKPA